MEKQDLLKKKSAKKLRPQKDSQKEVKSEKKQPVARSSFWENVAKEIKKE